jgi:hypothetical protein
MTLLIIENYLLYQDSEISQWTELSMNGLLEKFPNEEWHGFPEEPKRWPPPTSGMNTIPASS